MPLVMLLAATMLPTASAISGEGALIVRFMAGGTYVALSIARFVPLEVIELTCSALREWSSVTVARVITVVDVAVKAAMAVEPGAGSDKQSAHKPIGPVVAIGCAVIRSVVEVPVGTRGGFPNADADRNLGRRMGWRREGAGQHEYSEDCESKDFKFEHVSSLIRLELLGELRVENREAEFQP